MHLHTANLSSVIYKAGHALKPAPVAPAAPAPAPPPLQLQLRVGAEQAGAEHGFRSPSFLQQQETLREQEAKLCTQEQQIAALKARLDALELAPTADRPQVI